MVRAYLTKSSYVTS